MIRGTVNPRQEAVVRLRLRGPTGTEVDIEVLIDTGYTGSLTLPPAVVAGLGLKPRLGGTAVLADGTVRHFLTYGVKVAWGGETRQVVASGIGTEPLLGMSLLAGHRLEVDVEPGGSVAVRPL